MPSPAEDSDVPEDIRRFIAALGSEEDKVRISAVRSLRDRAERAAPAVPFLLDRLTDEGAEVDFELVFTVGELAVSALKRIGDPAFAPAVRRLQEGEPKMRAAVAKLLGQMGDRRAVVPLIAALQDPVKEVRRAAVDALGNLRDPAALKPLTQLAEDETAEVVCGQIPRAIHHLDGDHVEEIISLIELDKPALTRTVALCLSQVREDPRVVAPLLGLFEKDPSSLEGFSSFAFRQVYRHRGAEPLIPIIESKRYSPQVRHSALRAIENDPQEPEMAMLLLAEQDPNLRRLAAVRLSAIRPPNMTNRVFDALKQLDGEAYLDAVLVLAPYLGSTKDPRATLPLVEALLNVAVQRSTLDELRRSAIDALAKLNDPRAIDPLLARVNDPSRGVRLVAIHALLQIDHPRASDILRENPDAPESRLPNDFRDLGKEIEAIERLWSKRRANVQRAASL
jgi:HEAT repeat protein